METYNFDLQKANSLVEKYAGMGYYCSETVTRTLLECIHGTVDSNMVKISTVFRGGIATTHEHICGAASGALIVFSSLYGRTQPEASSDFIVGLGKEYLEIFRNKCETNSLVCDELREKRKTDSCVPFMQYATSEALRLIEKYQKYQDS